MHPQSRHLSDSVKGSDHAPLGCPALLVAPGLQTSRTFAKIVTFGVLMVRADASSGFVSAASDVAHYWHPGPC